MAPSSTSDRERATLGYTLRSWSWSPGAMASLVWVPASLPYAAVRAM